MHRLKKFHPERGKKPGGQALSPPPSSREKRDLPRRLELVLKCNTAGSISAVRESLEKLGGPVPVTVIHAGLGDVNKSDIILADSAGRLVVGFEVQVIPKIEEYLQHYPVEIRLYTLIYTILKDIGDIAASLSPSPQETEEVIGMARVIRLFKGPRHGIILGCEVLSGALLQGKRFRVTSAMGPIFTGRIESMHIEKSAVQKATVGQQVGVKINNFQKARIGDMVECLRPLPARKMPPWQATAGVLVIS